VGANVMQDEAADLWHGKEWRKFAFMHQRPPPQVRDLHSGIHILKSLYIVQHCVNRIYFSPLQVKNKPSEGSMNVHLSWTC
jgi:hypothetical protein